MRQTVLAYTWNFLIPSLGIKWWPLTIYIKDVMEAILCYFHIDTSALIPMTLCCSICARWLKVTFYCHTPFRYGMVALNICFTICTIQKCFCYFFYTLFGLIWMNSWWTIVIIYPKLTNKTVLSFSILLFCGPTLPLWMGCHYQESSLSFTHDALK